MYPTTHASNTCQSAAYVWPLQGQCQRQHGKQTQATQVGSAGGDADNQMVPPAGHHEGCITWTAEDQHMQCRMMILGRDVSLEEVLAADMVDGQHLHNALQILLHGPQASTASSAWTRAMRYNVDDAATMRL
jgi:hypothetical protein